MTRAAIIQMTSSAVVADNLQLARKLIAQAATDNAALVALPENFPIMGLREQDKLDVVENEGSGPIQEMLVQAAREFNIWIVAGTIPLRSAEAKRVSAASLVFNSQGERVARYDKMHLFDVDVSRSNVSGNDLSGNDAAKNERYRESATIAPGDRPVVVDTPIGRLGLGVCYDMRFPELFRELSVRGAQVLSLPSAFTVPTGQAHWDVLLRARAIENLCYVLAPAQAGTHANGRETYGNAMIVGPWGDVLARAEQTPSVICADVDLQLQADIRARFPALTHRRLK